MEHTQTELLFKKISDISLVEYPLDMVEVSDGCFEDRNAKVRIAFIRGAHKLYSLNSSPNKLVDVFLLGYRATKDNKDVVRKCYRKASSNVEAEIEVAKEIIKSIM